MVIQRNLYVTYGDILGNVYSSQLAPLWRELARRGADLSAQALLSPRLLFSNQARSIYLERKRSSPISIQTSFSALGYPPRFEALAIQALRHSIRRNHPTLIHARGTVAAGLVAQALWKEDRRSTIRLIYDVRGDTLAELGPEGGVIPVDNSQRGQEQVERLERAACSRSNLLFCVSQPLESLIRERYGYRGAVEIIPCWAERPTDWKYFDKTFRRTIRRELAFRRDEWVWCYAGSTAAWQALEETLDLVLGGKQKILLLTDDPQGMARLCKKRGLCPGSFRIRSGTREEVLRWMVAADAAILLRHPNEINRVACPMKFGDYLLAGLPVLVTNNIGDLSDWVHDDEVGEIIPDMKHESIRVSADRLVEKISNADPGSIQARARASWEKRLAFTKYLPRYLRAYGVDLKASPL